MNVLIKNYQILIISILLIGVSGCGLFDEGDIYKPELFPATRWGPEIPGVGNAVTSLAYKDGYVYAATGDSVYRTTYPDSTEWEHIPNLFFAVVDTAGGKVVAFSKKGSEPYFWDEVEQEMRQIPSKCKYMQCLNWKQIAYSDGAWFLTGSRSIQWLEKDSVYWETFLDIDVGGVQSANGGVFTFGKYLYWSAAPDFEPKKIECIKTSVSGVVPLEEVSIVVTDSGIVSVNENLQCETLLSSTSSVFNRLNNWLHLRDLNGLIELPGLDNPNDDLAFYDVYNNKLIKYRDSKAISGGWRLDDDYILFGGIGGLYRIHRSEIK